MAKKAPGEFAEDDLAADKETVGKFVRRHPVIDRRPVGRETRHQKIARQRFLIKLAAAAIKRR